MPVGTIGTDRSAGGWGDGASRASPRGDKRSAQGGQFSDRATTTAGYDGTRTSSGIVGSSGPGGYSPSRVGVRTAGQASPHAMTQAALAMGAPTTPYSNIESAIADLLDTNNTGWDDLGNILAGLLGITEGFNWGDAVMEGQATWGFDPAGLIGAVLGAGVGAPFLGTAASQLSNLFGNPLTIGLGTNVFGGGAAAPSRSGLAAPSIERGRDRRDSGRGIAGPGQAGFFPGPASQPGGVTVAPAPQPAPSAGGFPTPTGGSRDWWSGGTPQHSPLAADIAEALNPGGQQTFASGWPSPNAAPAPPAVGAAAAGGGSAVGTDLRRQLWEMLFSLGNPYQAVTG